MVLWHHRASQFLLSTLLQFVCLAVAEKRVRLTAATANYTTDVLFFPIPLSVSHLQFSDLSPNSVLSVCLPVRPIYTHQTAWSICMNACVSLTVFSYPWLLVRRVWKYVHTTRLFIPYRRFGHLFCHFSRRNESPAAYRRMYHCLFSVAYANGCVYCADDSVVYSTAHARRNKNWQLKIPATHRY